MLELDAPPRVSPGTSAALVLRLRNTGPQPATLYLRGTSIAFDFIVSDPVNHVVWQRLHGAVVPAIVRAIEIGPGERLEFRETWPLRTNAGSWVAPGKYAVVGLLLRDEPEPLRTQPRRLEVS